MTKFMCQMLLVLLVGCVGDGAPSCEEVCAAGRARGCPKCNERCEATCANYPWTPEARAAMVESTTCRFGLGGHDSFAVCDTPR